MHCKAWGQLIKTRKERGLGFTDIEAFNLALLGKQLGKMVTDEESLMAKVFRGRYFHKTTPLRATMGSRPSYA